jgi:PAS domain-containing protein
VDTWYRNKQKQAQAEHLGPLFPRKESWLTLLNQGKTYAAVTEEVSNDEEKESLRKLQIKSTLILPVFVEDQLWGMVGFDDCQAPRNWSAYEKSALGAIAAGIGSAVTRHNSKRLLQEQKTFYENVLNSIPSDVVVFSPDHRYLFINPVAVPNNELRGWLEGKDNFDYCKHRNKPVSIAEKRRAEFLDTVAERKTRIWEEELKTRDGDTKWVLRHMTPIYDKNEELSMVIGYGLDITAQKRSELKSRSLAKFPEENPHPVFRFSDNGQLLYSNKVGKPLVDHILENYDTHFKEMVDTAFLYGNVVENEVQIGEKTFNEKHSLINEAISVGMWNFEVLPKFVRYFLKEKGVLKK